MTKNAAIQRFFEFFGLPAFPATSVPASGEEMPDLPYITYNVSTGQDIEKTIATASVYYRSESWAGLNAKVDEISRAVGAGMTLVCDEGGIIVRKGSPWAQPMGDNGDDMINRKILSF